MAMQTFLGQMEGRRKRINDIVNETMRKRIVQNRKKLVPIMKTVVLCGQHSTGMILDTLQTKVRTLETFRLY